MKRDEPMQLPHIDPTVAATNPKAAAYAQAALARAKGGEPRGGAPAPPFPRLDQPATPNMTMADQAYYQRQPPQGSIAALQPPTTPQPMSGLSQATVPGILQGDLLTEAATNDPAYLQGMGSRMAVSQPNLAMKYGVIRSGRFIPPQQLQAGTTSALKESTVEGLRELSEFNRKRAEAEQSADVASAEQSSENGPGGAAAKLADPDSLKSALSPEEVVDDIRRRRDMDGLDHAALREAILVDLLNNDEQRKIVEGRLAPLSLTDYIMRGYVTQKVPVVPGEYEPEFISFDGNDDLELKRILFDEQFKSGRPQLEGMDRYFIDKYAMLTIALSVKSINGKDYGTAKNLDGDFDEKLFWKKYKQIMRLPFHLLASLGVHYSWFDRRVRKLVRATEIKNG